MFLHVSVSHSVQGGVHDQRGQGMHARGAYVPGGAWIGGGGTADASGSKFFLFHPVFGIFFHNNRLAHPLSELPLPPENPGSVTVSQFVYQ